MSIEVILILIGLFIVLAILLVGIIGMAQGGKFNQKYGNKLMRFRVIAQFGVVILLLLLWVFAGND